MSENPYTISSFMDAFIASLVLNEVFQLNIMGTERAAQLDRQGLHAVHHYAEQAFSTYEKQSSSTEGNDWLYFLVRARNMLGPGYHGSFVELRSELVAKTTTLVELKHPHDGEYNFINDRKYMESLLRHIHPNIALYADNLATAFVMARLEYAKIRA